MIIIITIIIIAIIILMIIIKLMVIMVITWFLRTIFSNHLRLHNKKNSLRKTGTHTQKK